MFTIGVHQGPGGFDPLILLVFALAIDAYVGEMRWLFRWLPHPVRIIGGLTAW